MASEDLGEFLDAACEGARRGAAELERWRARFAVREKGRFDLVTDADLASQRAIHDYLLQRFPGHAFLGEEGPGGDKRPATDTPPTWIVDPLDGTTNYVHDCPLYCVSIGLWLRGEIVVGVVLDPSRPELFSAAKGRDAWLNHRRLSVTKATSLDVALLATGFPPDMNGQERMLAWWKYFSLRTHSL